MTAWVNSLVVAVPFKSGVKIPLAITSKQAASIFAARASSLKDWRNIITTDKIIETGFAIFFPAISGAEP